MTVAKECRGGVLGPGLAVEGGASWLPGEGVALQRGGKGLTPQGVGKTPVHRVHTEGKAAARGGAAPEAGACVQWAQLSTRGRTRREVTTRRLAPPPGNRAAATERPGSTPTAPAPSGVARPDGQGETGWSGASGTAPRGETGTAAPPPGRGEAGTGPTGCGRDAEADAAEAKKRTFTGPWRSTPRVRMNRAMDGRAIAIRKRAGETWETQDGPPNQ